MSYDSLILKELSDLSNHLQQEELRGRFSPKEEPKQAEVPSENPSSFSSEDLELLASHYEGK